MKILVTGGAGYIGSVTVKSLQDQGHEVVVFDNLSYGHRESVNCPLIVGDLVEGQVLFKTFENQKFDGVIHFAAYALAGESMKDPNKYFFNNVAGGLNLLELMKRNQIKNIIFSSTCAVYGTPDKLPVTEDESKKPESVYGESKLMFEKILEWYDEIFGIKYMSLRYFNAAGAALDGSLGEWHDPETHIIPIGIDSAISNKPFFLNGDDYETADGTCVRDYIHVLDLASAHIAALNKLNEGSESDFFNLGAGKGYSNMEVIEMIKKVSGINFPVEKKSRRAGDPAIIYADNSKATEKLGFDPKYSDLKTIVESAWNWHSKNSKNKNLPADRLVK